MIKWNAIWTEISINITIEYGDQITYFLYSNIIIPVRSRKNMKYIKLKI